MPCTIARVYKREFRFRESGARSTYSRKNGMLKQSSFFLIHVKSKSERDHSLLIDIIFKDGVEIIFYIDRGTTPGHIRTQPVYKIIGVNEVLITMDNGQ